MLSPEWLPLLCGYLWCSKCECQNCHPGAVAVKVTPDCDADFPNNERLSWREIRMMQGGVAVPRRPCDCFKNVKRGACNAVAYGACGCCTCANPDHHLSVPSLPRHRCPNINIPVPPLSKARRSTTPSCNFRTTMSIRPTASGKYRRKSGHHLTPCAVHPSARLPTTASVARRHVAGM